MGGFRARYRPPANEQDFELLCLQLLRTHWETASLQLYASRGDEQNGVDICDDAAATPHRAAQCKCIDPSRTIPPAVVKEEVEKAKKYSPKLDTFWILTTAKKSKRAQDAIHAINQEHNEIGLFEVVLLTWSELEFLIDNDDNTRLEIYESIGGKVLAELRRDVSRILAEVCEDRPNQIETSRVQRVFVIGGETGEAKDPATEKELLGIASRDLGYAIAESGAELLVCSPFPDSVDRFASIGYVESGLGRRIHFHCPWSEGVHTRLGEFEKLYGDGKAEIVTWRYPPEEGPDSRSQAYLLCQLHALEQADAVVALGGKVSESANTLLHLAERRRIPVLPYAFLGGAARRAFERRNWASQFPELNYRMLETREGIAQAINLATEMLTKQLASLDGGGGPLETVFISRAKQDSSYSDHLIRVLESQGVKALLGDQEAVEDRLVEASIHDAISRSNVCAVLWSRHYALSRWCYDELQLATDRARVGGMHIWLFNLDGSEIVPETARKHPSILTLSPAELSAAARELVECWGTVPEG